jgi:hypothetical protein
MNLRVFFRAAGRTVPLGELDPLPEEGGGWSVTTWAKDIAKKQLVERDTDDDNDEYDKEETFVDERVKLKRREVKTTPFTPYLNSY